MKRIVSLVAVAVLVGAGVWGYLYTQSRGSAPKYRTARVERGPLTAAVSATGNLNAVTTVQVGSQVSGQIKELLADFNTLVKKDQVIARIDPEIFQAKVNQAQADVAVGPGHGAQPGGAGPEGAGRRGERQGRARRGQGQHGQGPGQRRRRQARPRPQDRSCSAAS